MEWDPFDIVSGLLVADKLGKKPGMDQALKRLGLADMKALEWKGLLLQARRQWEEFLDILVSRAPEDDRLFSLRPQEPSHECGTDDAPENTAD